MKDYFFIFCCMLSLPLFLLLVISGKKLSIIDDNDPEAFGVAVTTVTVYILFSAVASYMAWWLFFGRA